MSFINSILSGITGDGASPNVAQPSSTNTKPALNSNGIVVSKNIERDEETESKKRKAAEELEKIISKAPKREVPAANREKSNPAPVPAVNREKNIATSVQTKPAPSVERPTGSNAPSSLMSSKPLSAAPKPVPPISTTSSTSSNVRPGSYKSIMEKLKTAPDSQTQIGAIKHKSTTTMTKKERLAAIEEAKAKKNKKSDSGRTNMTKGSVTSAVKDKDKDRRSKFPSNDEKAEKTSKKVQVGYSGTARPIPQTSPYKGTGRQPDGGERRSSTALNSAPRRGDKYDSDRSNNSAARSHPRYRYAEDDEDEEEDYESDVSSDMEAAPHELEEEEFESARTARREDLEAEREEQRLKAEKKRRLLELSKKAATKKKY